MLDLLGLSTKKPLRPILQGCATMPDPATRLAGQLASPLRNQKGLKFFLVSEAPHTGRAEVELLKALIPGSRPGSNRRYPHEKTVRKTRNTRSSTTLKLKEGRNSKRASQLAAGVTCPVMSFSSMAIAADGSSAGQRLVPFADFIASVAGTQAMPQVAGAVASPGTLPTLKSYITGLYAGVDANAVKHSFLDATTLHSTVFQPLSSRHSAVRLDRCRGHRTFRSWQVIRPPQVRNRT
jgi:hypothetical protein